MVSKAKELGMSAVGITDHGTVAGIMRFLQECREQEIRPILGMEAYLSRDHCCHDKEGQPDGRKGNRHLNIIAKNLKGYENLCTLSQEASVNGYYYDPRVDWELLDKHKEGLIVTSACLSNVINHALFTDNYASALELAGGFKDLFGEDFYLEIMFHGLDDEGRVLPGIQKLSKDTGVKILAVNDCHYVESEDAEFQQVLMCMSTGRSIKDPKRIKFPYDEFYFKSAEEMYKIFGHNPSYMRNTLEVAEKCDYSDIVFGEMRLPKLETVVKDLEEGETSLGYLTKLAQAGLIKRGWDKSQEHVDRLNRELSDLKLIWDTKGYDFAVYFLIEEDVTRFADKKNIPYGVRGSGYGSLLLHCIGLCKGVDPLSQGLLWERFLSVDFLHFICEDDFGIGNSRNSSVHSDLGKLSSEKPISEQGSGAAG